MPKSLRLLSVLLITLPCLCFSAVAQPDVEGAWIGPVETPLIGIHTAMLRTGKFLQFCYPLTQTDRSEAWVFDPKTRILTPVLPTVDLFCSGHSFLADGRLLVVGGNAPCAPDMICGGRYTRIFDPMTETWSDGPNMTKERWYPTAKTLGDGRILIASGLDGNGNLNSKMEIYDPSENRFTSLGRIGEGFLPLYPWLHLMRSGQLFYAGSGPGTFMLDFHFGWYFVGSSNFGNRHDGTSVILPGLSKVMIIGGIPDETGIATNTAEIINFSEPNPQWEYAAPMLFPRVDANATLLPDKTVLVTGGSMFKEAGPVFNPELYEPTTNTWTTLAPDPEFRMYHSTAILLPSGLVVCAGTDENPRVTAFKPPYFFRGPRPRLGAAAVPDEAAYGETFLVNTIDAGAIQSVVLIRPTAVTHSYNHEQRLVGVMFEQVNANTLSVRAPINPNAAPPGYYMMFIVDGNRLPSRGQWIRIGPGE